jgi:hypothetical protein
MYKWLLRAARKQGVPLRIVYFRRELAAKVFKEYLGYVGKKRAPKSPTEREQWRCIPYGFSETVQEVRGIWRKILEAFQLAYGVDALLSRQLTGHSSPIGLAARDMGLPWIFVDREVCLKEVLKEAVPKLKQPMAVRCDLACVVNQDFPPYFESRNLCTDRWEVTGDMNTDYWHAPEEWRRSEEILGRGLSGRKLVLYFAFGIDNPLRLPGVINWFPEERGDMKYLQISHCRSLRRLVEAHGKDTLILIKKGHGSDRLCPEALEILRGTDCVQFISGRAITLDCIRLADLIIGVQTTALLEAMFTDKPIVYAGWGPLHDRIIPKLFPYPTCGAVLAPRSEYKLTRLCMKLHEDPEALKPDSDMLLARKALREQYFYKPDGYAASRVLQAIQQRVQESS